MPSDLRVLLGTSPLAPNGEAYETYKLQADNTYAKAVYSYVADATPIRVQIPAETPISAKITQAPTDPALRVTFDQAMYSVATPTMDGLLSSTDKTKLDALSTTAFNGTVGATTRNSGAFTTLSATGDASFLGRRRGLVVANGVSAGTLGTYNIEATGFDGIGSGSADSMGRIYLMIVCSLTANHQIQGVGMYTNNWNGDALLISTLGKYEYGGTVTFTNNANRPRAVITNTSGNVPNYSCHIVCLN